MKKLPVLLLILTVAMMPAPEVVAQGNAAIAGEEQRETTELPVVHEFDPRFHIMEIKPREGTVRIGVESPMGEDWRLQRVWFATFDYEAGWTETEVDGLLDEWTVLKADWTKVTKEQIFTNMGSFGYATMPLNIESSRSQYNLSEVNLPDILYYAAEFKDVQNEVAEPIWLKGKVDYRGCAHAKRFLEGETEVCEEVIDWGNGTKKYLPAEFTEEEEVVTWEEEWRRELAGRLNNMGAVLDGLAMIPDLSKEVLEWNLEQEEGKLVKIEGLLAKAMGADKEIREAVALKAQIAEMRKSGNDPGTGDDLGAGGDFESGGDLGLEDGSDSESGGGGGSGSSFGSGGGELEGEDSGGFGLSGAGLDTGVGKGSASDGVGSGVTLGIRGMTNRGWDGEEGAVDGVSEGKDAQDGDAEADDEGSLRELEVPKLGGARAEGGWIWWALGLSGVLTLFFMVVLKRKQRGNRQR